MIQTLVDYILIVFLFGFAGFFSIFVFYGLILFVKIIYLRHKDQQK